MKTGHLLTLLALLSMSINAQESSFRISIDAPANGSLTFEPEIPSNGHLPAGSKLTVSATPDNGFQLDSVYSATPGPWGASYNESMTGTLELTLDQAMTIGALFLPEVEFQGFTSIQNVVYAQPGVKALKYDVWSPTAADNLPMVIIVHGGGWTSNSEDIMRGMAREIVRTKKYIAVSIDYRWAGTADGDETANSMDNLISDVFGAIAHIQEHAAKYGGDPSRIAITGDSAGGHLSAVAATMPHMIGDGGFGLHKDVFEFMPSYLPNGKDVNQVKEDIVAAIQVAAPSYGIFSDVSVDMPNLVHHSTDPSADASWASAIAPIHHIPEASSRSIPQYFVRGDQDFIIQDAMVQDFVDALNEKGQRTHYDTVEGANHAFFDWKPDQQTRDTFAVFGPTYISAMLDFFDSVFYP